MVQIFDQFITAKVDPTFGQSAEKSVLYLSHLKVMLKGLDTEKLGLLRDI